jgi:hypothetical protein
MASEEFLRACSEQGLIGLIHEQLGRAYEDCDALRHIRETIAREARAQTAQELLRREELLSVLNALAAAGVTPILLKGTALAYGLYDSPASRPRTDTDLMIRRTDVDRVRRTMVRCGYSAPTYCDGELLFCQFPMEKTDRFGLTHTFDFHWRISTQSVFADLLVYEELAAAAVALPALGAHARTAGPLHALLLACVHPVMHHRNAERLIWLYDLHLLASQLSERDLDRFVELAVAKRVSAVCAHQLAAAHRSLGTRVPHRAMLALGATDRSEPSAAYLRAGRRWHDELISSMRELPRWSERRRLLWEVVFPGSAFMLRAYGLARSPLGAVLLPILYLHRLATGGWKMLVGQK